MQKSPLSYFGGKSRFLPIILPRIPNAERVVEPFCGGMSVSFRLAARGTCVSAYDIDPALVCFWQCLAYDQFGLYAAIMANLPMTPERYPGLRDALTELPHGLELAAAFFVVQRYSFASLGAAGGPAPARSRLHANTMRPLLTTRLSGISVERADFRDSIGRHPDDFLYLDPPYLFEKASKNHLYGRDGANHRDFDHLALFDLLKDRSDWLMSYGDNPTVRALYEGFPIETFDHQYTGTNVKVGRELLIHPRKSRWGGVQ